MRGGLIASLFGGLIGGLLGAAVMSAGHALAMKLTGEAPPPPASEAGEDATIKIAQQVSQLARGRPLAPDEKPIAGHLVHYGFGATMGLAYGVAARVTSLVTVGLGAGFGAAVWLGAHAVVVPALGLAPSPLRQPKGKEALELILHLAFGMTVGVVHRAARAARLLLLIAILGGAGTAHAQNVLDFVSFDGVDYLRWMEEPGRALTRGDLGIEFATVECSFGEDRRSCPYGLDAAAAFMPAGTKMHAVNGYRTTFRLAAVWRDRLFLYQAWRNPRAKVGGDLYDIAGKVRAIDVQRGEPTPAAPGTPARVTSAADLETLVAMMLAGQVQPPRAHAYGEPRYWITVWLTDGTTLGRPYFADTSEILGGLVVPADFRRIVERYLTAD